MRTQNHPETWRDLNARLLELDLDATRRLYAAEVGGPNRKRFRVRIYCRLNKLRADVERRLVEQGRYVP